MKAVSPPKGTPLNNCAVAVVVLVVVVVVVLVLVLVEVMDTFRVIFGKFKNGLVINI